MNTKYYILLYLLLSTTNTTLYTMQEMAVMMGAQQGAMIATQVVNKEYQEIFKSIQSNQLALQNAISSFSHDMKAAQKKQMNESINIFSQAETHISDTQSDTSKYSKEMKNYIFQVISIQQPQEYYLLGEAIKLDELFSLGTMYTPRNITWKNPFGIGNWEYDHITDSFWQLHNQSFINKEDNSSKEAMQNSIFTEYFNRKDSYVIQCEITLHQTHYPFFTGIMFNKSRWISGNKDSITKCRLLGIYGSDKNNVISCFSEQYAPTSTGSKNKTLYPLEQITQGKGLSKSSIDKSYITNLQTTPTTFIVKIITAPKEIQYKIWPKQSKEPGEYTTIKSHDPGLYLYHGIGFLSPGAIAQFKLLKPQSLLFTQSAIKNYTEDVQKLLSS